MDMNLSFSVLTANIISILLIGTLYLANRQKGGVRQRYATSTANDGNYRDCQYF